MEQKEPTLLNLDFGLVVSRSVIEHISIVVHNQVVVVCHGRLRKLTHILISSVRIVMLTSTLVLI